MNHNVEHYLKLNTRRLLRFYKVERERFYNSGYWCDCGCGEFIWEVHSPSAYMEQKYDEHLLFLQTIKEELDKREHTQTPHTR